MRVEDDGLDLVIRWAGEDHTALRVRRNRTGQHRWRVDAGVVESGAGDGPADAGHGDCGRSQSGREDDGQGEFVDANAGRLPAQRFTASPPIARANAPSAARRRLNEAAETLAVSPATVRRLIAEGVLPANQICKGAPWVIRAADIQLAEVVSASERRRKRAPRISAVWRSAGATPELSMTWRGEHYESGSVPPMNTALRCWAMKPPPARSRTRASLIGVSLKAKSSRSLASGSLEAVI